MRRTLALALFLAAVSPPGLGAQDAAAPAPQPRKTALITVAGEGTATALPDLATLTSGVVTDARTAREALAANSTAMQKVVAAFAAAGIAERDIATSGFSVQPRYAEPAPNRPIETPRITGYQVRNAVTVRVRDIQKLGQVLDAAVGEGSNRIGGLSFGLAEPDRVLDEARRRAVEDAKRRAALYAEAAGVRLGRLISIEADGSRPPPPRPMMMRTQAAEAAAVDVPVARGEEEVRASVTMVWEIEG